MCDNDGYSSTSIMYKYIKNELKHDNITYLLHDSKQHGITKDILCQIDVNLDSLIISPDGGTNDTESCFLLSELGFDILVIDHHEKENDNPYATIINNKMCKYPNNELCGAGMVCKFIEACDEEFWVDTYGKYDDINAIANIGDSMDLRSCETRYIVNRGLEYIKHPLIKAIIEKQAFSISNTDKPNITDISFYVVPLINAIARLGTMEEKDLMFKAFIEDYCEFEYTPRKSKNNPAPTMIIETIYQRVARLGGNVRAKQNKARDKALNEVVDLFDESCKKNQICFINSTRLSDGVKELSGLIAIKIADRYNKPCLVLRKEQSNTMYYSGSARNPNESSIDSLKDELKSSRLFNYLVGHNNAFGVMILKDNIPLAIDFFNKKFNKPNFKKVDFVLDGNIDYKTIKDIHSMKNIFCGHIKEPVIVINNVVVEMVGFEVKESKTGSKYFTFTNGVVEFIMFGASDNDELLNSFDSRNTIDVIGKCTINTYGGNTKPQFVIDKYVLR